VEIDLACSKAHVPNDWLIFSYIYAKSFAASFDPKRPESPKARSIGACVADHYMAQMNATECRPMNLNGTTSDELWANDGCMDKYKQSMDTKRNAMFRDCIAAQRRNSTVE